MRDSERDLLATEVQQRNTREAHGEIVFVLTVTEGPEKGQTYRLDGSMPTRTLIGHEPCVRDPRHRS
jgi:hypothetical protein